MFFRVKRAAIRADGGAVSSMSTSINDTTPPADHPYSSAAKELTLESCQRESKAKLRPYAELFVASTRSRGATPEANTALYLARGDLDTIPCKNFTA